VFIRATSACWWLRQLSGCCGGGGTVTDEDSGIGRREASAMQRLYVMMKMMIDDAMRYSRVEALAAETAAVDDSN